MDSINYPDFVAKSASLGIGLEAERLRLLKAAVGLAAEWREMDEYAMPLTNLSRDFWLSEAGDVAFWLVEWEAAFYDLYSIIVVHQIDTEGVSAATLLDLSEKLCRRSKDQDPRQYAPKAMAVFRHLHGLFEALLQLNGLDLPQIQRHNYQKLIQRQDGSLRLVIGGSSIRLKETIERSYGISISIGSEYEISLTQAPHSGTHIEIFVGGDSVFSTYDSRSLGRIPGMPQLCTAALVRMIKNNLVRVKYDGFLTEEGFEAIIDFFASSRQ